MAKQAARHVHPLDLIEFSAVYPALAVPDVADACRWYVEKPDFMVRFLSGQPPSHGAILFGAACLHFQTGVPQLGENWLYFGISNLDGMYQRARSNGVNISTPPKNCPWGMREFDAIDLNGCNIRYGQNFELEP
ncbi:VOC family protein [Litoreibacter arenae]|uniref:hypothetical protein n=1 Tax=Litoreibacter arenae TaxID=491388 RepID=UPI0012B51285|nr:hypothetical protein [Litoreibacter arenae]